MTTRSFFKYFVFIFSIFYLSVQSTKASTVNSFSELFIPLDDKNANALDSVVAKLAATNTVQSERVGYAGSTSETYLAYKALQKIATEEQLLKLIAHKAPTVRVYAYLALKKRKSAKLAKVVSYLKKDQSVVNVQHGCTVHPMTIKKFVETNVTL